MLRSLLIGLIGFEQDCILVKLTTFIVMNADKNENKKRSVMPKDVLLDTRTFKSHTPREQGAQDYQAYHCRAIKTWLWTVQK